MFDLLSIVHAGLSPAIFIGFVLFLTANVWIKYNSVKGLAVLDGKRRVKLSVHLFFTESSFIR